MSKNGFEALTAKELQDKSINFQTKLGYFLSPYSNISSQKLKTLDNPKAYLRSVIRFVQYGTGTGKTYAATNNYIKFQTMDIKELCHHQIWQRNPNNSNFTNALFITPNKNQIDIDKSLIKKMLEGGITPLSILGRDDITNKDTILWLGGKYSNYKRLKDYRVYITKILKLDCLDDPTLPPWLIKHIKYVDKQLLKITSCMELIDKLEKSPTSAFETKEDRNNEINKLKNQFIKKIEDVIKVILNNTYEIKKIKDNEVDAINDISNDGTIFEPRIDIQDNVCMKPIDESNVYTEIFALAISKEHYDDLITTVLSKSIDIYKLWATLKADILRVYAPLNYAACKPSFICLTSDKFITSPTIFRASYDKSKVWTKDSSYAGFAELIGNKESVNQIIPPIPSSQQASRISYLLSTILKSRQQNETEDKRTLYQKKDINFYVIIDESNIMFEKMFYGSDTKDGVVKKIFDNYSVTDLISVVERKYREYIQAHPDYIDCYRQTDKFFAYMRAYIKTYCEVDEAFIFDKYLLKFDFPPNILYIDNSEADAITNIIKNAFSVTAKNFIDKRKLQNIFITKRGMHRYISTESNDDNDITLYDFYQLIMSVIYAAIKFETSSNFSKDEKKAFHLELGKSFSGDQIDRQNAPLGSFFNHMGRNGAKYKNLLEGNHLDNEDQTLIDEWFAYIQTKLVFSLSPNKNFDASPDIGHQRKSFIDIKINLITHHPELELLKMTVNTNNYVYCMSATSGKSGAYAAQYNIDFTKRLGKELGVWVDTAEYDTTFDIDYREVFQEFRNFRLQMRDIDLYTFNNSLDLVNSINKYLYNEQVDQGREAQNTKSFQENNHSDNVNEVNTNNIDIKSIKSNPLSLIPQMITKSNVQDKNYSSTQFQFKRKYKQIKNYLETVNKNPKSNFENYIVDLKIPSFNYEAFERSCASLTFGLFSNKSSLSLSMKKDIFKLLMRSFELAFTSQTQTAIANKQLLKEICDNPLGYINPTFTHSVFGKFKLPLLNEYLQNLKSSSDNNKSKRHDLPSYDSFYYQLLNQYIHLVDLLSPTEGSQIDFISRLALYDTTIDKMYDNFKDHYQIKFVNIDNDTDKCLFTNIVSYNKAASIGLNSIVDNKIIGTTEDVNRLIINSLDFYTKIKDKPKGVNGETDGLNMYNKIENSIIYMRYLSDPLNNYAVNVFEFDSNLNSKQARQRLDYEHELIKNDAFRQTLGRIERKDSYAGFHSEIWIPKADLIAQVRICHILYKMDEHFNPKSNNMDYTFLSPNNYFVLQKGLELLQGSCLTPENRKRLRRDTERSAQQLAEFTDRAGFMGKLLGLARSGNQLVEHNSQYDLTPKQCADLAIEFDRYYREPSILFAPNIWLTNLKKSGLVANQDLLKKMNWEYVIDDLDAMYINLDDYGITEDTVLYQSKKNGLTDFLDPKADRLRPYEPWLAVAKDIQLHRYSDKVTVNKIISGDTKYIKKDQENDPIANYADYVKKIRDPNSELYETKQCKLLLHPYMLHMALGNFGELQFERFLSYHRGSYDIYSQKDIVSLYGYDFYEAFDFWLKVDGMWVCVDIKNTTHLDNEIQTANIQDSEKRKFNKIVNNTLENDNQDTVTDYIKDLNDKALQYKGKGLFDDSNELHIVFLNVRISDDEYPKSKAPLIIELNQRQVKVYIHYLTLFTTVNYLDKKYRKLEVNTNRGKKVKNRRYRITIQPKLAELLKIPVQEDIDAVFQTNVNINSDEQIAKNKAHFQEYTDNLITEILSEGISDDLS
ncbi:hypothetical protein [Psychrobacter sp. I-STPA6b]|uniref:hypothetical protein n=1 Tax=Psychrobacter sp. I-STPA6b TaxID=2585718 RepID=UPI001D0C8012|nr:hypothetical protein [Psychrobacter sp. I-STPA6b]